MIATPQMEPVSTLIRDHKAVFAKLANGPVWLAARSRPTAVLVAVEEWDQIAARLEELQDIVDILEAKLELAQSGGQLEEFDADEFPALADVQTALVSRRKRPVAALTPG